MSYKLSNYSKSTPTKWQVIGDVAVVLIPVMIGVIESGPFEPELKMTIIWGMSSLLAVAKVLTQFFSNE